MNDEDRAKALFFAALDDVDRRDLASAETKLRAVLALVPPRPSVLGNLAFVVFHQDRHAEARDLAARTTALDPGNAAAWLLLGWSLVRMGAPAAQTLEPFDRAIALVPQDAEAHAGRGQVLYRLGRYDEAAASYRKTLEIDPRVAFMPGELVHAKLQGVLWQDLDADFARIRAGLQRSEAVARPFPLLAMQVSAADQLGSAVRFAAATFPPDPRPLWAGELYRHQRKRIAYLSPDFGDHPVGHLMAGLFESHDQSRYEIFAIALSPRDGSAVSARIAAAAEHFVEVAGRSDGEIAALIRSSEIDIAVDLAGMTFNSRPRILARRPAPVQVNYLGFPGTMGSPNLDYIIADSTVIPLSEHRNYTEHVVGLPETFMPAESRKGMSGKPVTREQAGLPASGFVFCAFAPAYKITPAIFDVWMRLLLQCPGSVLWLSANNPLVRQNLVSEASRRGVTPERLLFAQRTPAREDHLARLGLADLFLDTPLYNAHSTACEMLQAGVPVLTCLGETFAGRVAGSLCRAAGVPELVADSLPAYEALALRLVREPGMHQAIRVRLQRGGSPLFDTAGFTRHLESAYAIMAERAERGLPPAAFDVPIEQ